VRRHFQVIVVGSGPAGASAAICLLRAGLTVAVVARDETQSCLPAEAFSPEVRTEFSRMGLAEDFPHDARPSYGIEALWGQETPVFHSYFCSASGDGLCVTRLHFHDALRRAVLDAGDCTLLGGDFLSARRISQKWSVTIRIDKTTKSSTCDLLVDATGRSAVVARNLGARRCRLDSLCGVSSVLDVPVAQQSLIVEATSYGWWYLTPIAPSQTLVCLISDVDLLQHHSAIQPKRWLGLLKETKFLSSRLGALPTEVLTKVHPCETGALDRLVGDSWIAIGDAASIVDPLSSAGVLKALRSGSEAATAIAAHLDGQQYALRQYEQRNSNEFQSYLRTRRRQYAIESRWPQETFWSRRLTPLSPAPFLSEGR
jgi:flavin-dependent dehydrogenase